MDASPAITIRDTSLRDGLQNIARTIPTTHKLQWLQGLYDAGIRDIEAGSFVPPLRMPQLADTAAVVAQACTLPGLHVTVLVPNLKGAQAALDSGAHQMIVPLSASHAHSLTNLRKTPDQVVQDIAAIRAARDAAGSRCLLEVGLSTAFGCTIQGHVATDEVLRLVQAVLDAGADLISLADTVGYADPRQVRDLFQRTRTIAGAQLRYAHFHDTRGLGMANVMAALDAGITHFDACVAGIGGCPHAPGASGNVCTEDLAYLMHSMGLHTGIDIDRLLALRRQVAHWLEGEALQGTIWRAGLPRTMQAQPSHREQAA